MGKFSALLPRSRLEKPRSRYSSQPALSWCLKWTQRKFYKLGFRVKATFRKQGSYEEALKILFFSSNHSWVDKRIVEKTAFMLSRVTLSLSSISELKICPTTSIKVKFPNSWRASSRFYRHCFLDLPLFSLVRGDHKSCQELWGGITSVK